MATELIKKEIDGREYEFEQMGAELALKTLLKLKKIVGRSLALSTGAFEKDDKGKSKLKSEALAQAVDALAQNATDQEVLDVVKLLCAEKALCGGAKINFSQHYEGKLGHLMFKVLPAALEVQYGNFTEELSAFLS